MNDVDLGTAVVTLAVGAVAVLPRIPALTGAGRVQASIQRDAALWSVMPPGAARDRLAAEIERRANGLLDDRDADKTVVNGWLYGTAWTAVAWGLLVLSTAVNGDEKWAEYVRTALGVGGLATGAVGVLLVAVAALLVGGRLVLRLRDWLRSRRHDSALTYEI